jgi:predicted helicase
MTARVHYADLWGVREVYEGDEHGERVLTSGKYDWLWQHDVSATKWTVLEPQSPFYLFVPQDVDLREEYEQGWKVTEIMSVNVLGFQSHRDHFAVDFDEIGVRSRISALHSTEHSNDELRNNYEIRDNRDWQLPVARKQLRDDKEWDSHFISCMYRPFDRRFCYFSTVAMDYPRRELLDHVAGKKNLCLNTVRQTKMESWQHAVVSDSPAPAVYVELKDGSNIFPLYLYPTAKGSLFDIDEPTDTPGGRRPNLAPEFIADFSKRLQMDFIADGKGDRVKTFGPEDVFDYMYAVFHSPTYRTRYAEFLKIDFPRLPLTSNTELFRTLCALGSELVGLHLMEQHAPPVARFPVKGDNIVETVRYTEPGQQGADEGRVWINKEQYFENVPPEVWNFHVGGYQVCQKWLKDRKGRTLTYGDLAHYQHIVAALAETIRLMAAIDATIEDHGGWPL